MTYLTIKYIKGNPYLYEVRSKREGDRVRQIFVRYLGRADKGERIERRYIEPEVVSVEPERVMAEVTPVDEGEKLREKAELAQLEKARLELEAEKVEPEPVAEVMEVEKVEPLPEVVEKPKVEEIVEPAVPEAVPEVTRLHELEFGTKEIQLDIKQDFSDAMTLREEASKLDDGLYTAGDNYVYSVADGKVKALPQYRSRFDYASGNFIFTEKPLTSSNIFDVPIFHGTQAQELTIDKLDIGRSGQNFAGVGGNDIEGIYFTTVPSTAKEYGSLGRTQGKIIEARISPAAKVIKYKEVGSRGTKELLDDGVDVVLKYEQAGDVGEVIVLNTNALQSPSPIKPTPEAITPEVTPPEEPKKPEVTKATYGVREFSSKKEAKEYISNMSASEREINRPQVREEFTYKPQPHNRIVIIAHGSYRLSKDGKFTKGLEQQTTTQVKSITPVITPTPEEPEKPLDTEPSIKEVQ